MSASSARRLRLSPGGVKSLALLERSAERANPLNMIHTLAVSAIIAVIKMRVCLRDGEHDSRGAPPPPPKSRKRWGPLRYHPSRNLSTPRGEHDPLRAQSKAVYALEQAAVGAARSAGQRIVPNRRAQAG